MGAPAERLGPLAGLRFAAALGILTFHYGAPLVAAAPEWLARVQRGGHVWVGLFFLLSGFVLAWSNPLPMDAAARRAFWAQRAARLYPAYALAFALSAPFALENFRGEGTAGLAKAAIVAAASLLLVHAWVTPIARLWNPPGWSTSAVATFYAAFPFVQGALARRSRAALWAVAALAWAAALALPAAWLVLRPDGDPALALARSHGVEDPFWLELLKFHPLARLPEFVAGVALGLLGRGHALRPLRGGLLAAAAFAACAAVIASDAVPYPLLHNGALLPLLAVGVVALATVRGPLGRVLASRPARALGDASFALYALQDPLWRIARAALPAVEPGPAFVVLFAATATAVAVGVSRGLERPVRHLVRAALGGQGTGSRVPRLRH